MTFEQAKNRVLLHAGMILAGAEPGFLARLRPYKGLHEPDFAELVECLIVLHPHVLRSISIDREICAGLWSLCEDTRNLALSPTSLLHRNRLITGSDNDRLEKWIMAIEYFSVRMLQGHAFPTCILPVAEYIAGGHAVDKANFGFLVPYLAACQKDEDPDLAEPARQAIAVLTE